MWQCPKCKREFKNTNQDHFCGEPPNSIDEYISDQPEDIQTRLHELRKALHEALPDAEEKIAWRMPTYKGKTNIIHFAAFKNHVGIYPGDKAVVHFEDRLKDYKSSKGAIQFSHNKPLPLDLIVEIAKWCYETGNHHGKK
ncbi:MAG: DUF1801 domain-containing protein [Bacillota bacterium]|nr:DUF1801 domain-containing protein [Bacillota bacterium]